MKGEEQLWSILNDKLDTLRASNRLPEAIRVAETALEVAKRAFPGAGSPLATSFEKLGDLLDEKGDRASLKSWEEATDKPPEDYEIVASNYADLLRSLGKVRKAHALEVRARKKRRI